MKKQKPTQQSRFEKRRKRSGPLPIARDCQSLGDQSLDAQTAFEVAYGPLAASGWVQEHNAALPRSVGLTDVIGRLAARASALRRGG